MITALYVTQGGGTAYHTNDGFVFHTVPDWGHYAEGDAVPSAWGMQAIGYVSVGAVESMDVTERDGYEAGYANKGDPNPFIEDTYHYDVYKVGRERGDRERAALDDYENPWKD